MNKKLNVGVIGASGFSGGELCRLLLNHENVDRIFPTSRGDEPFEKVHQNLLGCGLEFLSQDELQGLADTLDVVIFCTPSGEAMHKVSSYLNKDIKVIDLGPDFRFPTNKQFRNAYGRDHASPELLEEAIYGITEFERNAVSSSRLVANPGCYAITCILGLMPALKNNLLDHDVPIHISAVNGTSGSGGTARRDTSHTLVSSGMLPYSLEGHRHSTELEHHLSVAADRKVEVVMNTTHGSFPRGIQAFITAKANLSTDLDVSRESLIKIYHEFYGIGHNGHFFVIVNGMPKNGVKNSKEYHLYPNVARVSGSNFCQIGLDFDLDRQQIKIVAITDNLVKGAAGSAIQNMNVMCGFDETTGLKQYGL